jgi:hydrogenase maturation protein HypF
MHNRDIQTRCDDSVLRVVEIPPANGKTHLAKTHHHKSSNVISYHLRRSRGYAPNPINLLWKTPQILATGPELKNTFCLTKNHYAFLSHHIGDMENYETLKSFEDSISHYEKLFRIKPVAIACDLHPNYLATRYALKRAESENISIIGVQHHHAHIASCLAEHRIPNDHHVIGVSFDGTGYGDDDAIWGGEFFISNYEEYQRVAHLKYVPLPGGDKAIREPWRIALAWLYQLDIRWNDNLKPIGFIKNHKDSALINSLEILRTQLQKDINAPKTSSIGRLFDAVSSLIGICHQINYEAQAAIEIEAVATCGDESHYTFNLDERNVLGSDCIELNPEPVFHAIINDLAKSTPVSKISAKFHNGLADAVCQTCALLRDQLDINEVVLSGGVWQNMYLLRKTLDELYKHNFNVYIHNRVPANDGGLALGQAAVAYHMLRDQK